MGRRFGPPKIFGVAPPMGLHVVTFFSGFNSIESINWRINNFIMAKARSTDMITAERSLEQKFSVERVDG